MIPKEQVLTILIENPNWTIYDAIGNYIQQELTAVINSMANKWEISVQSQSISAYDIFKIPSTKEELDLCLSKNDDY